MLRLKLLRTRTWRYFNNPTHNQSEGEAGGSNANDDVMVMERKIEGITKTESYIVIFETKLSALIQKKNKIRDNIQDSPERKREFKKVDKKLETTAGMIETLERSLEIQQRSLSAINDKDGFDDSSSDDND